MTATINATPKNLPRFTPKSSAFNPVDLAPARFDEVVIVLHDLLHFLHGLALPSAALHHAVELIHTCHLHLRHEHPKALAAKVGHDPHLRHADLGAELVHRDKLLHHGAHFAGLAEHDFAN